MSAHTQQGGKKLKINLYGRCVRDIELESCYPSFPHWNIGVDGEDGAKDVIVV